MAGEDTAPDEPIRLLVVDDEPDARRLFEARLRREVRAGALELHFAVDGRDALAVVDSDPRIEVVVTDLNMPEMDGLELLGHLEALPHPVKTIVLTAYGDMDNIRTAMMRGAFDFQVKPLDITDLRATVAKAAAIVRELRAGREATVRARVLADRNDHLREVFGRYVSEEVVAALLADPDRAVLEGEVRRLTLLMADIRGFTRLSEQLPPDRLVILLNRFLEMASEILLRRRGTLNEILGDGLLVFFGAPIPDEHHAEHAVAAALELQLAMAELNARNRSDDLPELAVGIAVHTGDAVVGTLGSSRRAKYGAVGPNVNLVSRIEDHTVGGQVLVSQETYDAVRELVSTSGRFPMRSKGVDGQRQLHVVGGMGAPYDLHLPQQTYELNELPVAVAAGVARILGTRIGETAPAEVLAVGDDAVVLRTSMMLAPLDDVAVRFAETTAHGKVCECDYVEGMFLTTIVLTAGGSDVARAFRATADGQR